MSEGGTKYKIRGGGRLWVTIFLLHLVVRYFYEVEEMS